MFESTSRRISAIFKTLSGNSRISEKNVEEAVEEIKIALLDADVNLRVVRRFVNATLDDAKGTKVLGSVNPAQQFVKIVLDRITALLESGGDSALQLKDPQQLSVVLLAGLQGSGKTTTASKLAYRLKGQGRRVLLAACDLVRPAAIDQLEILGKDIGVPVFSDRGEKDPVKLVGKAVAFAKKEVYDTLIVDTSGRMNVDEALMKEISDIAKAVNPVECLFVADSMTGQKAADIASDFNAAVPITGVILTKFDSDARGGAAMSIASVVKKPIKFAGTGEKCADLDEFHPDRAVRRILGMGDVVSLVEQAQREISDKEAEKLAASVSSGDFTIADYLRQMEMMGKMGGMEKMASMLPGVQNMIKSEQFERANAENEKDKAIIFSMTKKERENYRIIGPPRRKRIAAGSGTTPADVDRFIRKFEKMKLTIQKVGRNRKFQANVFKQLGIDPKSFM